MSNIPSDDETDPNKKEARWNRFKPFLRYTKEMYEKTVK